MIKLNLDYSKVLGFLDKSEIDAMQPYVTVAHNAIHEKTGLGNDFLGWVDLPKNYNKEEFSRIKKAAEKVKSDSDVLLVIGIGGSYLGARAAIEMASHSFRNNLSKEDRKSPEIYFVGQNISSTYMMDLLDVIKDKDVSLNVISKSGTTTEPAIAFRVLKEFLENKYGYTPDEMDTIMNKKSGMLGVSGISSDGRDIEAAIKEGNPRAILTQNVYVNRIVEVVSGYYGLMGGADAIVFAGGIGENDCAMRQRICDGLSAFGVVVKPEDNDGVRGVEKLLSAPESKMQVWLLPTNEELVIARDAYKDLTANA